MKLWANKKHLESVPRVKIVAVARDEGAYIAEWVFHHLHFGFDAIQIYVNRTTDNTREVVDLIKKKHPQVRWQSADWIDFCAPPLRTKLQNIVYAQEFERERKRQEFTHLFFIDIDEFWIPKDFETSIRDFLQSFRAHQAIAFQWYCALGDEEPFSMIANSIHFYYSKLVKSLINLEADVETIRLHTPKMFSPRKPLRPSKGIYFSNGEPFKNKKGNPQIMRDIHMVSDAPCFLLHRLFRSELEYLSVLLRGTPTEGKNLLDNFSFKANRPGFFRSHADQFELRFQEKPYSKYRSARSRFFKKVAIDEELTKARQFILNNTETFIDAIHQVPEENITALKRVLAGVTDDRVRQALAEVAGDKGPVTLENPSSKGPY